MTALKGLAKTQPGPMNHSFHLLINQTRPYLLDSLTRRASIGRPFRFVPQAKLSDMATTDLAVQAAILILALAIFVAIQYFPKQALNKIRTKNRANLLSNRHFIQGTHFLSRAKSTQNKSQSQTLAKNALSEAESAITLSPRDAAPLILKALTLDFLGHKGSALKSLDLALSSPRVKSLEDRDRGDALVKRAELKIAVNRKRRVDSAIEDLKEAVKLSGDKVKAFGLLGQCYELKGMKEEAQWAFKEALRIQPQSVAARTGLDRAGLL